MGRADEEPTPSLRQRALAELGQQDRDALSIGGVPARELVEQFGSPLYAFDAAVLRRRFEQVRRALGPRVGVLYAIQANPGVALARVLREAGAGCTVVSAGELRVARAAGFGADSVQLTGPGKSLVDLEAAIDFGLGAVNLESAAELDALCELLTTAPPDLQPRVAIRVNPGLTRTGVRLPAVQARSRFGVDRDQLSELAARVMAHGRCDLTGLYVHAGTQCFDAAAWAHGVRDLFALAAEVEDATGRPLVTLTFGGAFGVGCFEGDPVFDLDAAGRALRELVDDDAHAHPERRCFVELGRYLTAEAGVYLTRVQYLKDSGGRRFAVLDGGQHHHAAAAGAGTVMRRAFAIVHAERLREAAADEPVTLGGPLCAPADEFGTIELPALARGDVLAVLVSGAYGLTYSSTLFQSHPTPAEVLVDAGRAHLIRERGTPADALRGQRF